MEKWRRPALCRLCRFPAGSDGIPVSRLDAGKLSRWWRKALQTEREEERAGDENALFCQFCLFDAKFLDKYEANNENCDWWLGEDANQFYTRFYFSERLIRHCAVILPPLPEDRGCSGSDADSMTRSVGAGFSDMRTWKSRGVSTRRCHFCAEVFKNRIVAFQHMQLKHKNRSRINCNKCFSVFLSIKEKKEHFKTYHENKLLCHICPKRLKKLQIPQHIVDNHAGTLESMICCSQQYLTRNQLIKHMQTKKPAIEKECIYCNEKMTNGQSLHFHIAREHKSEAIFCKYIACRAYFHSHEEKQKHIKDVHESKPNLVDCTYCTQKLTRKHIHQHVRAQHQAVAIQCKFHLCISYFQSEEERGKHELKVHFATKVAPGFDCIYCGERLNWISDLHQHVRKKHKNVAIRCKIRGCGSYFLTDEDWDTHTLEKHAADDAQKKWKCGTCDFRTNGKSSLYRHEFRHKPKTMKCPHCPKLYSGRCKLQEHVNVDHQDAKICVHCKAAVESRHRGVHLQVRPCKRCKLVTPCMGIKKAHMEICTANLPGRRKLTAAH